MKFYFLNWNKVYILYSNEIIYSNDLTKLQLMAQLNLAFFSDVVQYLHFFHEISLKFFILLEFQTTVLLMKLFWYFHQSLLYIAYKNNDLELVKYLLKYPNIDINDKIIFVSIFQYHSQSQYFFISFFLLNTIANKIFVLWNF